MSAGAAAGLALLAAVATAAWGQPRRLANSPFRFDREAVQGGLLIGTAPAGAVSLALDGREIPIARDGRFLLGFDRDAPSMARLSARFANGRELAEPLFVERRVWRIEFVNLPRPTGGPTPEFQRLREDELARITAARAQRAPTVGWSQAFIWPARGRISGAFGSQRVYRGGVAAAYHSGIDLAAGAGALVIAPADGIVTLAPPPAFSLEGNLVIVDHGMGLTSAFLHLASVAVRPRQVVRQGDPIGTVGATGRARGPHLHWGLVWNGARVDPQSIVGTGL